MYKHHGVKGLFRAAQEGLSASNKMESSQRKHAGLRKFVLIGDYTKHHRSRKASLFGSSATIIDDKSTIQQCPMENILDGVLRKPHVPGQVAGPELDVMAPSLHL